MLTVGALLLSTVGGFGTTISLLGFSILRCYNRMSIFIAFLALTAICMVLDLVYRRWAVARRGRLLANASLALLLLLGLADQTGRTYIKPFAVMKESYQSDADFVAQIEAAVPEGTMVFQLPYVSFLSYTNSSEGMLPYSHFRGYLHSHTVRWSYGAMHGRSTDTLHAQVASLPLERSIRALALLGFGGIYVDHAGYADGGKAVESRLRQLLDTEPLVSRNGRLAFFKMANFNRRLRERYPDEEWQRQVDLVGSGPQARWDAGFFTEETNGIDRWHWCGSEGTFTILNRWDHPADVSLCFTAKTCRPGPAILTLESTVFSEQLTIDTTGTPFAKTLRIPPGALTVHCRSTGLPYSDGRTLVFALFNFEVQEADSTLHAARN
jgi:phosphoglycerol transferase